MDKMSVVPVRREVAVAAVAIESRAASTSMLVCNRSSATADESGTSFLEVFCDEFGVAELCSDVARVLLSGVARDGPSSAGIVPCTIISVPGCACMVSV